MIELLIQNGSNIYEPVIEGSIQWMTERKGQPGKLTFTVLPDAALNFQEGNAVRFKSDDQKVFYGFVFTKQRSKDKKIKVVAYDQIRYMKNKASYQYSNKTATEVSQALASQFGLKVGILEDTVWKIPLRVESNSTLMDIQLTALDLTTQNTGKIFVLYDDFGELMLKDVESMKLDVLIDNEAAENFSYSSSIDGETYNRIKLYNKNTSEIVISEDQGKQDTWGILQFFDYFESDDVNVKAKADSLLDLYNKKTRSLTIKKAFGDPRIRAGSLLPIQLALGDLNVLNYLIVEKVTHTFSKDEHFMDLKLKGGVINA